MPVSIRYHVKSDTYYFQIQGEQWLRINNKIRHISTRLRYIQDKKFEQERAMLEEKRRRLLRERRKSERYVKISAADVPKNVPARPIHDLPGQIVTAEPKLYAQLLDKLRERENRASMDRPGSEQDGELGALRRTLAASVAEG